ncbi:MAG: cobalt-precorrin 5A hydrolase [Pseudodesulfovibrio sp.]|jgi:cobalt-precorrin 5A hydrolase|uniref:Cobalamin biosynthesis protein CbiG n=1 Tax=Pseudodesulfovibrio indicus TaxID=1716143 RepID=A0A126QKM6_9BACT|nr:cobalt-precorrin 5A hydrolase [Pseudodesulfovibrio indicus]AMK10511.1 cobalamin biosynthesis protein CbiG [Pseudodesulfovibrio indicus]TDT89089.1 cobalt-precorrin 5A acetaldehyde-lyase [Pseudodesulfovibrio indicus]
MPAKKIAIYALTSRGLAVGTRLAAKLPGTLYASKSLEPDDAMPFESLTHLVSATFNTFDGHVFVAAAGIVVRCIAPHLQSKETDPAVVCMDQNGRYAVSLLSGHLGGANELADRCARIMGGLPVITTATDTAGVLSIDTLADAKGLVIGNIEKVKNVNMALLEGHTVQLYDPEDWLGLAWDTSFEVAGPDGWNPHRPGIWVSWHADSPEGALSLHPRVLHLGIGCRRDVTAYEILDHVHEVFRRNGFAMESIASVGSVEAKRNEAGLLEAAAELGAEPVFYSTAQLAAIDAPTPSDRVQEHMGVPSVAEASALLAAHGGELIVTKEKTSTVTLAVALTSRA